MQVYLIGDPVQLPATVISKRAVSYSYDISLFKRLQMNHWPVIVLDTQYRMHPEISAFPSLAFYGGGLQDGPGVRENTERPWHEDKVGSSRLLSYYAVKRTCSSKNEAMQTSPLRGSILGASLNTLMANLFWMVCLWVMP